MGALTFDLLPSYDKSLQPSKLDKGFYLLFQVETVIGVVAMVPVKMTVLVTAPLLSWGTFLLEPLDAWVVPVMEEHLFHGCVKRGIVLKPTWGEVDQWPKPMTIVPFSHPAASIFPRCLLLFPFSLVRL